MLGFVARSVKDRALSLALKTWLNDRFREFGEITDCVLDSDAGSLKLEAMLKGEKEPIVAVLEHFDMEKKGNERVIVLHEFSSSRPWLGALLTRLFAGKRYPLPGAVAAML